MLTNWKISTFNGALLASYFIPSWAVPALKIVMSPVHGLYYERANIAVALFLSDHLQLGGLATVRFAWLLALARLTVVAFFALFLALTLRPRSRTEGAGDEALGLALALGSVVSFTSMVLAAKVGEATALRLHATELLLLLSVAIVFVVETARKVPSPASAPVAGPEQAAPSAGAAELSAG